MPPCIGMPVAGLGAVVEGVGSATGGSTGASVGEGTGASVGEETGASVGEGTGASVGEGTGASVVVVGISDELADGLADGLSVAGVDTDGESETGTIVGTGVPAWVAVGLAVTARIVGGLLAVSVGVAVGLKLEVSDGARDSAAGQKPLCGGSKLVNRSHPAVWSSLITGYTSHSLVYLILKTLRRGSPAALKACVLNWIPNGISAALPMGFVV